MLQLHWYVKKINTRNSVDSRLSLDSGMSGIQNNFRNKTVFELFKNCCPHRILLCD